MLFRKTYLVTHLLFYVFHLILNIWFDCIYKISVFFLILSFSICFCHFIIWIFYILFNIIFWIVWTLTTVGHACDYKCDWLKLLQFKGRELMRLLRSLLRLFVHPLLYRNADVVLHICCVFKTNTQLGGIELHPQASLWIRSH